jgi:hypothetical protein
MQQEQEDGWHPDTRGAKKQLYSQQDAENAKQGIGELRLPS